MAAARSNHELDALKARVTDLEKQLQALQATMAARIVQPWRWPERPRSEEETEAFHQANQWVENYLRKQRETDLKRVNANIDRLEAKEKAAAARNRKPMKNGSRARRAG